MELHKIKVIGVNDSVFGTTIDIDGVCISAVGVDVKLSVLNKTNNPIVILYFYSRDIELFKNNEGIVKNITINTGNAKIFNSIISINREHETDNGDQSITTIKLYANLQ